MHVNALYADTYSEMYVNALFWTEIQTKVPSIEEEKRNSATIEISGHVENESLSC